METFDDIGIPFPLFEAAVSEASEYVGKSTCVICGLPDQRCFDLRIGCALIVPCPACHRETGLDTYDRKATPCPSCRSEIAFPDIPPDWPVHICQACLRTGKGAIAKDTEFGMVSWEQAVAGITHGIPGLQTTAFERVLIDPEDEWYGVRVPREHLFELVRTPTFNTWQGECWLFCCQRPMAYIGEWQNLLSSPRRPEDPRAFFQQLVDREEDLSEDVWEGISHGRGSPCLYVFQCKACSRYRANSDSD